MFQFFASCPRGLEALLVEDLTAAGALRVAQVPGGAQFTASWEACYRANLHSSVATRILWRIAHNRYTREEDIYKMALAISWTDIFDPSQTIRCDTVATRSPLRSLEFVTLRVKDAICDRFRASTGIRPSVDTRDPDVRISLHLTEDEATLYVDTSGNPLWQRGERLDTGEAPLKENLAAGILRLSGWQPGMALLDPMCGSGTFLLEAAQMAKGEAPGLNRTFGFERLTSFDPAIWRDLRNEAAARVQPLTKLPIVGSDIDGGLLRKAQANLRRAGLEGAVELKHCDARDIRPHAAEGIWVTNPPYGVRIGEANELAELYPELGDHLKAEFAGWTACFFSSDTRLPKLIGLRPDRKTPLYNGKLECRLYQFRIVAGFNRRTTAQSQQGQSGEPLPDWASEDLDQ